MLEQMRETGLACGFVGRADVVPHRDIDDRRLVVLVHDHGEAVVELEFFVLEIDRVDRA